MKKVRIRENSWIARLAARHMGFGQVAIVIGRTIHLHNTTVRNFINNQRWLLHELKHVEQYEIGLVKFLTQYLLEHRRNGYRRNRFEIEARAAETQVSLLVKYDLSKYLRR